MKLYDIGVSVDDELTHGEGYAEMVVLGQIIQAGLDWLDGLFFGGNR